MSRLLEELPRFGVPLAGHGLLVQLHRMADAHTAIIHTSARRLAEDTAAGARSVEHVRSLLRILRELGLAVYATDRSGHKYPIFLTHFLLAGKPLRMTRPFDQVRTMVRSQRVPGLLHLHRGPQSPEQSEPPVENYCGKLEAEQIYSWIHAISDSWIYSHKSLLSMVLKYDLHGIHSPVIQISRCTAQSSAQSSAQSQRQTKDTPVQQSLEC